MYIEIYTHERLFNGDNMNSDNNISDVIFDNVDIVEVISEYVNLKRTGKNYKALCPFHSEKTPSFVVSEDKQLFHCFGCGAAGNVIQFIMKIENFDFWDAIEFLSEKYNIDLDSYKKNNFKNKISSNEKNVLYDLMRNAGIFYYKNLSLNKNGQEYLKNRGIKVSTSKKFGIGYALPEWDSLIKKIGKNKIESLERVGLIIKRNDGSGYYDRFRNRIIFPIIDIRGKIIGFGGRVLDDSLPKYLNSPETILFDKSKTLFGLNIAKDYIEENNKTIIVTEGYMDVISLYNSGIYNSVATLGTAFTKEHSKILERYVDNIIICYDSDDAGIKATRRTLELLKDIKAKVKVLQLGNGMDPDEYIKKFGKDKFLAELLTCKGSYEYQIEMIKNDYDLSTNEGQFDFIKKAVEIFGNLEDNIKVEYLISVISKIPFINEVHVRKILKDLGRTRNKNISVRNTFNIAKKRSAFTILEERLIFLSFGNKENFNFIKNNIAFDNIVDDKIFRFFNVFQEIFTKEESFELTDLSDYMEVSDLIDIERILRQGVPYVDFKKEVGLVIYNHDILILENEIKQIKIEREKYLKLLNSQNDIERDKIILICNELTKKDNDLHVELKNKRHKLNNWKGGKLIEQ